jgi:hypothetical protein
LHDGREVELVAGAGETRRRMRSKRWLRFAHLKITDTIDER